MYNSKADGGKQHPLILFATSPALNELLSLTVSMANHSTSSGKFQPQVIKCREIIFTEPDVIGTPHADITVLSFHIVAQAALMKSGKIQNRLSRIGLQVHGPFEVCKELYQACLRYTLTARLSPNWNMVGSWFVQGREFLSIKGCANAVSKSLSSSNLSFANAVKADIRLSQDELFFTLEATTIKLTPMKVTDLDIAEKQLEYFMNHPTSTIEHHSILGDWCYVLPSMKKGRIVSISHELPEESPFVTYRDIKRHWKNTYGYRLPETEEGMCFYQVQFWPLKGKIFTYPGVCLRGRELQFVRRVDPKPILRSFIIEVQNKFPTVCGQPMKLQTKAKFTVHDLSSSNQVASHPNLTSKMTNTRPAVYRSKAEMETLMTQKPDDGSTISSTPGPTQNLNATQTGSNHSIRQIQGKHVIQTTQDQNEVVGKSASESEKMRNSDLPLSANMNNGGSSHSSHSQFSHHGAQKVNETPNARFESSTLASSSNTGSGHSANSSTAITKSSDPQASVNRKLFPKFSPAVPKVSKTPAGNTQAATRVIPIFSAHKKTSISGSASKKTSDYVGKVSGSSSFNLESRESKANNQAGNGKAEMMSVGQSQNSKDTSLNGHAPNFKNTLSNAHVPSFKNTGKSQKKAGGKGKEEKTGKGQKRPREGKKQDSAAAKKAKKLIKPED